MIQTVSQFKYVIIFICVFLLSFSVKDWRCRAASTMLLVSLILSYLIPYAVVDILKIRSIPWMLSEMTINLLMIYGFWNLHFRVDGEEREPLWPVAVLGFEALIFLSTAIYWIGGYGFYNATVNVFFLSQAVIVISVILWKHLKRYK